MYLAQYNSTTSAINNIIEVELMDDNRHIFEDIFSALYDDKVIINSSFGDDKWKLTDRYGEKWVYFDRIDKAPSGYTVESYSQILKRVVLCRLRNGSHYSSVCDSTNQLIELGNNTNGFRNLAGEIPKDVATVLEFLIEELDIEVPFYEVEKEKVSSSRKLEAEEEYYRFEQRLEEFWGSCTEEERVVFFPLYLFWKLCNIIPTRPKEYCLIPYDCVQEIDGQFYLSLPKSNIKGNEKKSNNNADTYPLSVFQVPADLAKEIVWYQSKCTGYLFEGPKARRRLFNNVAQNEYFHINSGRMDFRRKDISYLLDKFYVCYARNHTEFHVETITKWRPGDLRHLALSNMIDLGVDPAVCMYFAGHSDMTMCLHYGNKINTFSKLRIHQPQSYAVSKQEKKSEMDKKNVWCRLPNGYCKNNYGSNNNWQCANYPNDVGCPYFVDDGTLSKTESFRVELWQNFCNLCMKNEYKRAKDVLVEFQRQTAIYEGLLDGKT